MKKTIKFLSIAALALVGAVTVGCSSDDSIIDEPQQHASKSNVVTLTTTVSLDGGAQTRALTADGKKTFAVNETMALVYKNTSNETVKVVSTALTDGDITNEGKSATFTFELTDPDRSENVTYIYPAAMANADGSVNDDALATQDGTLATLSSSLDLATYSAAWDGTALPTATLANQLAILALTLKNSDGTSDITSSITGVTLSDGTNSYAITRSAAAGPIYVAIRPTSSATIDVTATDGTNEYRKTLSGKTYAANNGYNVTWKMSPIISLSGRTYLDDELVIADGYIVTGSATSYSCKVAVEDGATVTLRDVENNNGTLDPSSACPGIRCIGDATIILEGNNTVNGGYMYAGIYVPEGKTLTIRGTGTLTVTGGSRGAGIGGNIEGNCGSIVISGGTITATGGTGGAGIGLGYSFEGVCGDITISGGTVTATGCDEAPGIGGRYAYFQNITITDGVTKVTVNKGSYSTYSIGTSEIDEEGYYGAITIGGTVYFNDGSFENGGDSYLQTSQLVYPQ